MAAGVNLRTTNDLPIDATNPLQVTNVGGTGATAQQVQGNVASGAAVVGNPVYMGSRADVTALGPTPEADGDLIPLWLTGAGALVMGGASVAASPTAPASLANQALLGLPSGAVGYLGMFPYKFNGTAMDLDRKPSASSRIVSAAASTNATSAKASAGDLHITSGNNVNAAIRYLKIYNKATAPVVGTDIPVITMALEPLKSFHVDWGGQYFSAGIAYALTTGAADADTGALTAGDILGLTITYA